MLRLLHPLFAAAVLAHASLCWAGETIRFTPQAVREDLRFALAEIDRIHPDRSLSVDPARLQQAAGAVDAALDRPLTRDEAWAALARLNPVLADGHLFLGFANWRADTAAHLKAAGTLFLFEVFLDAQGAPRVRSMLGGAPARHAGARIVRINGRDATEIAAAMLERVHGDTDAFRRHLLGQRWWLYYWKLFGAPGAYAIELEGGVRMEQAASREVPQLLREEQDFEGQFQFKLLQGRAAYLKLGTFAWPDPEQYFAFTRDAFARMRAAGVQTLVIDIRANSGGNDDLWINGVMRYVAGTRFRWASSYKKRVLAGRVVEAGQQVGDVVSGEVERWIEPDRENPLRFAGRVYVLTGAGTYSSAILFSNAVQDFGVGKVAGVGNAARSRQSGGTQNIGLPNTGLMLVSPRLVLTRPSGVEAPVLFAPDLALADDPLDPGSMVAAVLAYDRQLGNSAAQAGKAGDSPKGTVPIP